MFCLVERQACRKTPFVDGWADWVKPFFERGLFVFRVLPITEAPKEFDPISIPSDFEM
jgi:hypothetical protein